MRKILLLTIIAGLLFPAVSIAQNDFTASLDGSQEVPAVNTPATGFACITVLPNLTFDYHITFSGLLGNETGAHIHGPAGAGTNGPVLFPLPLGSPKTGNLPIADLAQLTALVSGQWYINIHTDQFPGGEIRGQILPGACPPAQVQASSLAEFELASVYTTPFGTGDTLAEARKLVPPGDPAGIDATITVTVLNANGAPVEGILASDITLESTLGGFKPCPGGAVADNPTDVNGQTTISGPFTALGHTDPGAGERTVVSVNGIQSNPLNIHFNGVDTTGEGVVGLGDVGAFACYFGDCVLDTHPANYRADYVFDGRIDILDLGTAFALDYIDQSCDPDEFSSCEGCMAKTAASAPSLYDDVIGVYFDLEGHERSLALEPGQQAEAHVLLRGPSAAAGITAWENRIASSDNVVITEWVLNEGNFNLQEAPSFIVGLGGEMRAIDGAPMRLMTIWFHVADREPAFISIQPSSPRTLAVYVPAIAMGRGENSEVKPLSVDSHADGSAARINAKQGVKDTPRALTDANLRVVPNPFNPSTEIWFDLPRTGSVQAKIYDVGGRTVCVIDPGVLGAGSQILQWNGTDASGAGVSSGLYYARLFLDGRSFGRSVKMSLIK